METWAREPEPERLVETAAEMGLRLVVVARDGTTWAPPVDPAAW